MEIRYRKIQKVYDQLFTSSLAKVRDAALADRLFHYSDDTPEVCGRSLAWKLFLIVEEPLKPPSSELNPDSMLNSLRSSRKRYAELLSQKMKAPDGSYPEGFIVPGSSAPSPRKDNRPVDLERNNPLSLHNDNPWTEWFAALELKKTIAQDVERTFPEIDFFRNLDVQDQLTNILFLYTTMNPDIGYRQGMHELLAPLYYAVDVDSLPDTLEESNLDMAVELCSQVWVAADAWVLFESVMRYGSRWYEWRERPLTQTLPSPLSNHVQINPDGKAQMKPYIAPIVQDCNEIQSTLLHTTDPLLWKHLQSSGLEPQIYGIRWLRLLFTREFSMPDAMRLWDVLFACDPTLDVVPWICVAMLIRIRNVLIPSDYTTQLTTVLRYPTPVPLDSPTATHHTSLLVRQALNLQSSPTPATGVSLVVENRNLLDIPMEVPEPPPAPRRRGPPPQHSRNKTSAGHARQQSSQQLQLGGFPEMLAHRLFERGESLNINKTLMSAVTELKRNIPELAASFVRSPLQSPSIPLLDERQSDERPPWEPKSRLELEREMSHLRINNKRLGESLGWVVDTLLQDASSSDDPQRLKKRKQEALESLSYIRDFLINGFTEVEDERLYGEEELAKRKLKAKATESNDTMEMPKPAPASVVDTRLRTAVHAGSSSAHPTLPQSPSKSPQPPHPSSSLNPPWSPNSTRLAPWNYTKSNFSQDGSSLPATSLPRLPPPTSNTLQRSSTSAYSSPVLDNLNSAPAVGTPAFQRADPLGVLK
ncbi:rab-GTPase-TBC domain-containing protein [Rhodocollybia butyracea]|uniref:Rab-GTPase-TBC domain-containing protein n=1 Tax=Rhodocollybia butyracea TaxID=206335 RepID=A0A9P5U7H8_9AGAR|nr:rab-GTPase-TBC domain-containing protein [Rhodocollybia butyracea]